MVAQHHGFLEFPFSLCHRGHRGDGVATVLESEFSLCHDLCWTLFTQQFPEHRELKKDAETKLCCFTLQMSFGMSNLHVFFANLKGFEGWL